MSDHETSYYEIALTHRQVVVSFVVLLVFVLASFLLGVWVCKSGHDEAPRRAAVADDGSADDGELPENLGEVEEFRFPDGEESAADEDLDKPDLSSLGVGERPETTLAQDLGREPPPSSDAGDDTAPDPDEDADSFPPPPRASSPDESAQPAADEAEVAERPEETQRSEETERPQITSDDGPFEPTSVTPAPSPLPPGSEGGFVVQVFSGRDEDQAKKVVETLEADGYDVFLSPVRVGTQMRYRVRIGPYAQRSAAEEAERVVKRKYRYETWVTAAEN